MTAKYHRGTIVQFNTWHEAAKTAEGIPAEGKVGFVNGVPAPQNQRTTAYSEAIQHPNGGDDYVWVFGGYPGGLPQLTRAEAEELGWFSEGD